jgi:hypothetical protein
VKTASGARAVQIVHSSRLRVFATDCWRQKLAKACARHAGLGPASLVLYDVSTLSFETGGDGFREPGFSKERRLEPRRPRHRRHLP